MADPMLLILRTATLTRGGRPPVVRDEPTACVSTRLPISDVDALILLARARDMPVAALARELLRDGVRAYLQRLS